MNRKRYIFIILSLALPIIIFSITAWQTYGWDDEIFTINWLEKDEPIGELIHRVNNNDTHPIGMYVLDFFFYNIFKNWHAVRVSGAIFVAISLWLYWFFVHRKMDLLSSILRYILLCINPSVLLWCSGLRWQTWLMPLMCFLGLIVHKCKENFSFRQAFIFWSWYFLLCVLMFHVSYWSVVVILSSFLCICYERRKFLISELKIIVSQGIFSLLLILYQSYFLLTVHIPNGKNILQSDFFSRFRCVLCAGQQILFGSATIPVSWVGLLCILVVSIILFAFLLNMNRLIKNCSNKIFILSYLTSIFLRIGVAARYYTNLAPQQAEFIVDAYSCIKNRNVKILIILIFSVVNIGGVCNVMLHQNTFMTPWDTPYPEIIKHIAAINPQKQTVIFTINPVLRWWLKEYGFNADNIYNFDDRIKDIKGSVIAIKTFRAGFDKEKYQSFCKFIDTSTIEYRIDIGHDKYSWFRQIINKEYPDYYAQIFLIRK